MVSTVAWHVAERPDPEIPVYAAALAGAGSRHWTKAAEKWTEPYGRWKKTQ